MARWITGRIRRIGVAGAVVVAALLIAAVSAVGAAAPSATTPKPTKAMIAAGKKVFKANCGLCHTLADAGTHGSVGPNLDKLKPKMALVIKQVTNGGKVMPSFKGRLSKAKITDVAAYVSSVAGKKKSSGGGGGGGLP